MNYSKFLEELDSRLNIYFNAHKKHIKCRIGCSLCCEKGDYPTSQMELEYLMQGYISLNPDLKRVVQENIKNMKKGGVCPFLHEHKCTVYKYRPIICRVHGLAYLCKETTVKVPYCVHDGKNYSDVYANSEITINPILENLETANILKKYEYGEIRNLYDWININ